MGSIQTSCISMFCETFCRSIAFRKGQQHTKAFMEKNCKLVFVGDGKNAFPEIAKFLAAWGADHTADKLLHSFWLLHIFNSFSHVPDPFLLCSRSIFHASIHPPHPSLGLLIGPFFHPCIQPARHRQSILLNSPCVSSLPDFVF